MRCYPQETRVLDFPVSLGPQSQGGHVVVGSEDHELPVQLQEGKFLCSAKVNFGSCSPPPSPIDVDTPSAAAFFLSRVCSISTARSFTGFLAPTSLQWRSAHSLPPHHVLIPCLFSISFPLSFSSPRCEHSTEFVSMITLAAMALMAL